MTEARKIDRAAFAGGVQSSLDSIFSRHFSHSARSARAVPHAFASTRSHSSGWCCAARGAAAEATSRRRSIVPIIIWPAAELMERPAEKLEKLCSQGQIHTESIAMDVVMNAFVVIRPKTLSSPAPAPGGYRTCSRCSARR